MTEPILDTEDMAMIQVTVWLPGTCTESGEPERYGHRQLIPAAEVAMRSPRAHLSHSIERATRALETSLRIR